MARIFSYSGRHAKILLEFTDKEPIFVDLSVIKTHFTDKLAFSSDLSVNFWPLWWGFTDKAVFLDHFVRKTKVETPEFLRTNGHFWPFCPYSAFFERAIYGQTTHFHWFVRKRQWFCQMQHSLNQRAKLSVKFAAKLFWVISIMEGDCHSSAKKPDQICDWLQIIRFFNLRQSFFPASFTYAW